jgi:uncharacterized membrane protein YphA (DoxX/SURF4 family)
MVGFGVASLLADFLQNPGYAGGPPQYDVPRIEPVLLVGGVSTVVGAIFLLIGRKVYPAAWKNAYRYFAMFLPVNAMIRQTLNG